ncbi:uncharacterized protein LOC133468641 [Phyllopteryx taeniolatus]|uniref:uncharacterized protein LOC133468641 n=1 Tax=Phyllopteryx taeniolatus TaxID=161469 RepID=UPI002AD3D8F4|nr:uncharacterized protein LOC133468641 [Phyllopteryx taeniolatus]
MCPAVLLLELGWCFAPLPPSLSPSLSLFPVISTTCHQSACIKACQIQDSNSRVLTFNEPTTPSSPVIPPSSVPSISTSNISGGPPWSIRPSLRRLCPREDFTPAPSWSAEPLTHPEPPLVPHRLGLRYRPTPFRSAPSLFPAVLTSSTMAPSHPPAHATACRTFPVPTTCQYTPGIQLDILFNKHFTTTLSASACFWVQLKP